MTKATHTWHVQWYTGIVINRGTERMTNSGTDHCQQCHGPLTVLCQYTCTYTLIYMHTHARTHAHTHTNTNTHVLVVSIPKQQQQI